MSKIDISETKRRVSDVIQWVGPPGFPNRSFAYAMLEGDLDGKGLYYTLVKWYPGYMSAPHHYATDRLCVVVSGTWWVNSGADFDPGNCVPTPAGSFVLRVAGTPHYDGVIAGGSEPTVVAICGISPVDVKLVDPKQPPWHAV